MSVYDKAGKLVSATYGATVLYASGEEKEYSMNIAVSDTNIGAVRLYTWEDMSVIKPHTDYYIVK